jgi:hypothetical protein
MATKIGHAHSDESNKARGGKAGDQTLREVVIQDWYRGGWTSVFRAKDTKVAEKIAKTMELSCENNNIGYDQNQRTTLYEKAKILKWDVSKINEKCECDCSSLVAVCVNAAGIKISKDMYTGNQKKVLSATGRFEILEESKYLAESSRLRRGDILLGPGHTAVVLTSSNSEPTIEGAKSFSKSYIGTYSVTATKLNVRCGAGVSKSILRVIPKETKVKCYGYYTKNLGTTWLYIQYENNHTGFVSMKYLKLI